MSEFDLDLGPIEQEMDAEWSGKVVLGVLDGSTSAEEWLDLVGAGNVLVLAVEGMITDLAADFAPQVRDGGGALVHFRDFLVVTPPDIDIDRERL